MLASDLWTLYWAGVITTFMHMGWECRRNRRMRLLGVPRPTYRTEAFLLVPFIWPIWVPIHMVTAFIRGNR